MLPPPNDLDMLGIIGLCPIGEVQATLLMAARPADAPLEYVVTANAQHLVLLAEPGSALRQAYDAAWLRLNDGQIARFLARWATGARFGLAAGSDIARHLLERHITAEDAITIIGGAPGLPDALRARFAIRRIYLHDPPMGYIDDPAAVAAAVAFVRTHPSRFIFVTTGTPRSEAFLMRLKEVGGITGTGCSFGSALRFAADEVPRAPAWMRSLGLEWLFRLASEPRRLWRRYVIESSPIFLLAWRAFRRAR